MKFKKPSGSVPDVDMTPMIDIVFQLIAFFMIISNFEQLQADERVKLPKDPLAKPPETKRDDELVVNLGYNRDKDGKLTDTQPYVFMPPDQYTVPEFQRIFNRESRLYRDEGTKLSTVTVIIRADGDAKTGLVQELIQQAQNAGFEKFALKATQQSQ